MQTPFPSFISVGRRLFKGAQRPWTAKEVNPLSLVVALVKSSEKIAKYSPSMKVVSTQPSATWGRLVSFFFNTTDKRRKGFCLHAKVACKNRLHGHFVSHKNLINWRYSRESNERQLFAGMIIYSHLLCIFTLFYVEDKHVPASESTGHHLVKENKTKRFHSA